MRMWSGNSDLILTPTAGSCLVVRGAYPPCVRLSPASQTLIVGRHWEMRRWCGGFPMLAAASPVRAETRVRLLIGDGSYANEVGRFGDPHKVIALALHIG